MAADPLSRVFSALADPTRRDIVARLAVGDASVNELAEPYDVTVQAVSKHLKVLGHRLDGDVVRFGELVHARVPHRQSRHDVAPRGVCQSREHSRKRIGCHRAASVYSTASLNKRTTPGSALSTHWLNNVAKAHPAHRDG